MKSSFFSSIFVWDRISVRPVLLDWKLGSGTFFFSNESHLKSSLVDTENELGHHHFRVVEDLSDEAVGFGTQRRDVLKHVMAHERRL